MERRESGRRERRKSRFEAEGGSSTNSEEVREGREDEERMITNEAVWLLLNKREKRAISRSFNMETSLKF